MKSHCVICGLYVSHQLHPKQWQSEYRAIRLPKNGAQTPFLTGVGLFDDEEFLTAPSNPNQRYSDSDYQASPLDTFPAFGEDSDTRQLPCFLFHEPCWGVLKALIHPQEVPIDRLYKICHSFSLRKDGQLVWGHSYGGLVIPYTLPFPRWMEDLPTELRSRPEHYRHCQPHCHENPFYIPWLEYISTHPEALIIPRETEVVSEIPNDGCDRFRRLPAELREAILNVLQSEDVINLRLASRSFASIPLSQTFWRSRFNCTFERNHIFEAFRESNSSRDWRAWYNSTRIPPSEHVNWRRRYDSVMLHHTKAIKNRKRIWNCSRSLAELLTLSPLETNKSQRVAEHNHIAWRMAGFGSLNRLFTNVFNRRVFQEEAIRVPARISRMSVSLVIFNGAKYVSGFRINPLEGQEILLGHIYPEKEVTLDIGVKDGDGQALTGFIIAMNGAGIRAIRAVMEGGHTSQWVGDHKGFPLTIRLCMNERITHLKSGFDGFKMFSLSVPEEERIKNEMPNLPLRKSGLWYPEIPSARETIHEYIYLSLEPPTSEFRPFIYLNFGGDRGSHLKHLTKISVATQGTYLSSIRFHYGTEVEPVNLERLYLPPDSNNSNISYDIDGPGGERIIGICVKDAISMQNEKLFGITGLQIFTNKNRSITFDPNVIPRVKLPFNSQQMSMLKRMDVDAGTTMTGFYAQYKYVAGMVTVGAMVGIGMISEKSSDLDDL